MSDDQQLPDDPSMVDEVFTDDELAALGDIDALLADPALWGSPSAGVEDGVVGAIAAARRTELAEPPPVVVSDAAPPSAAGTSAPVVDITAARGSRRRTVWSLVGAAVAGAAAAALITGAVVSRDTSPTTADQAPSTAAAGGSPADGAQNAERVSLAGTDLAPGVSGSAQLTAHPSGVEINVDLPGLPPRTGGDFYQLWAKNCAGTLLVPAGSFHDLTDAIGWVGVSMADFPVLTITQESAAPGKDAAQGSSGLIVASGTLGSCPS